MPDARIGSCNAPTSNSSQKIAVTVASTPQVAPSPGSSSLIYCDAAMYFRANAGGGTGVAAITVATDGTDQVFPQGVQLRVYHAPGTRFSFATITGTGNAYITPES